MLPGRAFEAFLFSGLSSERIECGRKKQNKEENLLSFPVSQIYVEECFRLFFSRHQVFITIKKLAFPFNRDDPVFKDKEWKTQETKILKEEIHFQCTFSFVLCINRSLTVV